MMLKQSFFIDKPSSCDIDEHDSRFEIFDHLLIDEVIVLWVKIARQEDKVSLFVYGLERYHDICVSIWVGIISNNFCPERCE